MAGQGLTGAGGVISADAGGRWWIDFPVESEWIMEGGDLRELKEIGMAHLALRYAHKRFGPVIAVIVLRERTHSFVLYDDDLRD
jgi:hypothetical protein